MTIIINVCWADKLSQWYDRYADSIKEGMFLTFLIGSIPSLIISLLRYFNITQVFDLGHLIINEIATALLFVYGILSIYIIALFVFWLSELNTEHHWFELKHCKQQVTEDT